jgi:hypothetical protein
MARRLSAIGYRSDIGQVRVKEPTEEQQLSDESRQEFIQHVERMMGRPLTRQEINMAILQVEQIGHL